MFKAVVIALSLVSGSAFAQSSLGITGAEFTFSASGAKDAPAQFSGNAMVDVLVTQAHGAQFDLGLVETNGGAIGSIGVHSYMVPKNGDKYGLFANVSDADGRAMTWASVGAEGVFAINEETAVAFRGGVGAGNFEGFDYIFAGASIYHEFSECWNLSFDIDLAEFDETAFRAIGYSTALTLNYEQDGSPFGAYFGFRSDGLHGRDGAAPDNRLIAGVTFSFGNPRGNSPEKRPFMQYDPVLQLLDRGIY